MIATRAADGTFANPTPVVGAGADPGSPRLAVTARGDEVLVWQTGTGIRSAFHAAGDSAWAVESVGPAEQGYATDPVLAVDSSGRAVVAWVASSPTGVRTVRVSIRPRGGSWSEPVTLASDASSVSLATDSAGDVAVAYDSNNLPNSAVWVTTMQSGESTWDMPTSLARASQDVSSLVVVGGGARTFVVTWGFIGSAGAVVAARVQLPGSWEAPRIAIAGSTVPSPSPGRSSSAIDDLGNALVVTQYKGPGSVLADASARLAVTDDQWAPSTILDVPDPARETDSGAGVTFARDGSATMASMRTDAQAVTLHVASTGGPTGPWIGADSVAGTLPCLPARCANEWRVTPAVALAGSAVVVVAQSYPAGVVIAFSRPSPETPWHDPVTLQGFGSTRVYLRSAHVRKGYIRIFATCALPPCRGTVVLREPGGSARTLGRVPFSIAGSYAVSAPLQLPRWARTSLKHGKRIRTHLTLQTIEGNGTTDAAERTVLLHA